MELKRRFDLGTPFTLFNDCFEYIEDDNDLLLIEAYNKFESEVKIKSELYDGNDSYLNEVYDELEKSNLRPNNQSSIPQNMLKYVQCSEQEIEMIKIHRKDEIKGKEGWTLFQKFTE